MENISLGMPKERRNIRVSMEKIYTKDSIVLVLYKRTQSRGNILGIPKNSIIPIKLIIFVVGPQVIRKLIHKEEEKGIFLSQTAKVKRLEQ